MTLTDGPAGSKALPDLSDPSAFADGVPHEVFAYLRDLPGLYWQATDFGTISGGFWAVTRWEDIVAIEKDPATFTSTRGSSYPMFDLPAAHPARDSLMLNDPPRHSRLRRAAAKGFGPRIVRNFEPWVREIVAEELDRIDGMERFDWVTEIAQTIPARVIARVLGTPREDQDTVVGWVIELFRVLGDPTRAGEMDALVHQLQEYAAVVQERKRVQPDDDMFTALGGCVERGELSQGEFLNWMQLMMGAGFETTHTTIGQSMRMVLEDTEVARRVAAAIEQGLSHRVVHEFVRLVSPVMEMARSATTRTTVAGQEIRENDALVLYYCSANRDPSVFTDPHAFDPLREERDVLSFGAGVHRCIGEHLAKLEIRVLWEELHRRDVRLRLDGQAQRGWSVLINQLTSLPVARVRA